MPWLTMAKVIVPKVMPMTDPKPPVSNTPPTTTEMIELKMNDIPVDTWAELNRMVWHRPTNAALTDDRMNRPIVSFWVGMPALRAPTLSPPSANSQLPHGEKWRK